MNRSQASIINKDTTRLKSTFSTSIKTAIVFLVLFCIIFGVFRAKADGYKNWTTRLLYFTFQSNVWIGVAELLSLIYKLKTKNDYALSVVYRVRYVFTTSIIMTGLVFYVFLAPFAKGIINVWSPISVIFHGVIPLLAFIDFIIDDYRINLSLSDCFLTLIPPIVYYSIAIILCYIKLDFGLGTPYPYFFLDVYSPAGMFGFFTNPYFFPGTFYWLIFFGSIMFIISILLKKLNNKLKKSR